VEGKKKKVGWGEKEERGREKKRDWAERERGGPGGFFCFY
jgi:hypothetical protein